MSNRRTSFRQFMPKKTARERPVHAFSNTSPHPNDVTTLMPNRRTSHHQFMPKSLPIYRTSFRHRKWLRAVFFSRRLIYSTLSSLRPAKLRRVVNPYFAVRLEPCNPCQIAVLHSAIISCRATLPLCQIAVLWYTRLCQKSWITPDLWICHGSPYFEPALAVYHSGSAVQRSDNAVLRTGKAVLRF